MIDAYHELERLTAFPSVSYDPERREARMLAAGYLANLLERIGCEEVEQIDPDSGSPLVYGQYIVSDDAPTVGIYGHYDVQPEDPVDLWETNPFEVTRKGGSLYGRGVADNKGHVIQNIAAVAELIAQNRLAYNVIFMIEGEEESGSPNFERLLQAKSQRLAYVDYFMVTDVQMYQKNIPQIFTSLRGIAFFDVTLTVGNRDVHSGVYGNMVHNPALLLTSIISKLKDVETGEILIDGFYDDVRTIDEEELALLEKYAYSDDQMKQDAQVKALRSVRGVTPFLAPGAFPGLDINGFSSGFQGEGTKTIIPASANCKFSIRFVEYQNAQKIADQVVAIIKESVPDGVECTIAPVMASDAFYTDYRDPVLKHIARVLQQEFNHEVVYRRSGGSTPAAEVYQRLFGKPVGLIGFSLPDDNIHAPNENMNEEMFWKGIDVLKRIYAEDHRSNDDTSDPTDHDVQ
jgi:acetylornithine deacetylase/succinyl-diaminopimelate desuccinylase-like protein